MADSLTIVLLLLGLFFAIFVLVMVLSSVFIWLASKILKFRKQNFGTAIIVSAFYNMISLIVTLGLTYFVDLLVPSELPVQLIDLFLAIIISAIVLILLIRQFYAETWTNSIIAFVIITVMEVLIFGLIALFMTAFIVPMIKGTPSVSL